MAQHFYQKGGAAGYSKDLDESRTMHYGPKGEYKGCSVAQSNMLTFHYDFKKRTLGYSKVDQQTWLIRHFNFKNIYLGYSDIQSDRFLHYDHKRIHYGHTLIEMKHYCPINVTAALVFDWAYETVGL